MSRIHDAFHGVRLGAWAMALLLLLLTAGPLLSSSAPSSADTSVPGISRAQHLFYSGRYQEAAAIALAARERDPDDLEGYELRPSALHFQVKRALEEPANKGKPFAQCLVCGPLMSEFLADTTRGLALARARLAADPRDESAMFFLGKLDFNYVWLQLGTLGRKTGWSEYWEARRTLDEVLKQHPDNIRARVARAWIDYIVDTKLPRGTKWLLGGGNKQKGLAIVREAAQAPAEAFVQAEAGFALWDMQVRERNFPQALATARALLRDFPDNQELIKFIEKSKPL